MSAKRLKRVALTERYFSLRRERVKQRHSEGGNRATPWGVGAGISKFLKKRENNQLWDRR